MNKLGQTADEDFVITTCRRSLKELDQAVAELERMRQELFKLIGHRKRKLYEEAKQRNKEETQ